MRKWRYEIVLPATHMDERLLENRPLDQTRKELEAHFNESTQDPHPTLKIWISEDKRCEQRMQRLVVEVDAASDHREFFPKFKAVLKERFHQIDIYIASYAIDVV